MASRVKAAWHLQVEDIKAILGSDSGYEVALLLEPAPPAPLDAITDDVLQLVNEPRVSGATEAESKAAAAAANASGAGRPTPPAPCRACDCAAR